MSAFYNPVNIIITPDFAAELGRIIDPAHKVLCVCSARFSRSVSFAGLKLEIKGMETFTGVEENPSFESCAGAIAVACAFGPDALIAIGGGSVLDTAKVMRMGLYKDCADLSKLLDDAKRVKPKPLFIAVPTTHGTGSEVTMWATVWDKNNKLKYSLSESDNYPDYAVYDARLLDLLPLYMSMISTLDALSHAFEALWNKNANPVSDAHAIKAIALIYQNISFLSTLAPASARENLFTAARYAGLAFSNTRTAAAHSISYPLTGYFNIPHGIACSMPLEPLARINAKAVAAKFKAVCDECGVDDLAQLWDKVRQMAQGVVPFCLSAYGIKKEDLNWLNDKCFTKGRVDNNIVDLTSQDIGRILEAMY